MTSTITDYSAFFRRATSHESYDYQRRLGTEPLGNRAVIVPTAAGKTAAVIVAWLWKQQQDGADVSRRLVYCLPMRTLTEQTVREAAKYLKNLGLEQRVGLHTLMGGQADEAWAIDPLRPAIIVGTQEMIVSRLLNRGFAMNPFRWPVSFGLLANDTTWVFDEVQLFGAGLATSLQLQEFRERLGCFGNCHAIWMSATCRPEWLETVDREMPSEADVLRLSDSDRRQMKKRLTAAKALEKAPIECRTPEGLASFVRENHRPGTITLVVANRVERAVDIYRALKAPVSKGRGRGKGGAGEIESGTEILLLHSRFRRNEKGSWSDLLTEKPGQEGRILVTTQVIEAGVDLSAALMITDLAPYPSLVQRFGRVNRGGEFEKARILWVDRPVTGKKVKLADKKELSDREKEEIFRPYECEELERAKQKVERLDSANPSRLPDVDEPVEFEHVLRRRDIVDLFDTTPDLGGNDLDISRFIRGGTEHDVYVAWREWGEGNPPAKPSILDRELCPVPIYAIRSFLRDKKQRAWTWRPGPGEWQEVDRDRVVPGMRILLHSDSGGYTESEGWNPDSAELVTPVTPEMEEPEEAHDEDRLTFKKYWQTLRAHTDRVVEEVKRMLGELRYPGFEEFGKALLRAGRAHDWGKALIEFQKTLHGGTEPPFEEVLAKSCNKRRHDRPHLRHELGSALALLANGDDDLVAFLAAAHHGRIRMSIRSMPDEKDGRVRGIDAGDVVAAADLGGGVQVPERPLPLGAVSLGVGEDGSRSWADRMTRLRDRLGPFRLAYLEALLRMADERASTEPGKDREECPE